MQPHGAKTSPWRDLARLESGGLLEGTRKNKYRLPSNLGIVSHVATCSARAHVAVAVEGISRVAILALNKPPRGLPPPAGGVVSQGVWELSNLCDVGVQDMPLVVLVAFLRSGDLLLGGSSGEGLVVLRFRVYRFDEGKCKLFFCMGVLLLVGG